MCCVRAACSQFPQRVHRRYAWPRGVAPGVWLRGCALLMRGLGVWPRRVHYLCSAPAMEAGVGLCLAGPGAADLHGPVFATSRYIRGMWQSESLLCRCTPGTPIFLPTTRPALLLHLLAALTRSPGYPALPRKNQRALPKEDPQVENDGAARGGGRAISEEHLNAPRCLAKRARAPSPQRAWALSLIRGA